MIRAKKCSPVAINKNGIVRTGSIGIKIKNIGVITITANIAILSNFPNYLPYWAIPFGKEHDWNRDTIRLALEKELLLFFHTNEINYSWNGLGLNRIPCDGKNFKSIISNIRI